MRHRRRVKHFSRKPSARKALIRGLVEALVEHGRITTTVEKAKEARRHVEKAITLGKKGTLAARRLIVSRYPSVDVKSIVDGLSVRFKERPGGYTRITKIGKRPGDNAEMAFIEFVDYDFVNKSTTVTSTEESNLAKENEDVRIKKSSRIKRKVLNGIQSNARRVNRA